MTSPNYFLLAGGLLSLLASLLHLAIIVGGGPWYRFFGAGERLAGLAERGSWWPGLITLGIALVLAVWAAYAFAGAGLLQPLPWLRLGLVAISAIYLLRGLVLLPVLIRLPLARIDAFTIWSSLICLGYGLAYALGTWRDWAHL